MSLFKFSVKKKRGSDSKNDGIVSGSTQPSSQAYFYGRITREEAELCLKDRGAGEGLFLLRESITSIGYYVISVCHKSEVFHYSIEKLLDGQYRISGSKVFPGPVELLQHFQEDQHGFVTKPNVPCDRLPGQSPMAFRGIAYFQFEKSLLLEAKKIKADVRRAMGPLREQLMIRVAKNMHFDMPWWHGKISREEAELRLKNDGHVVGKFLLRDRDGKNTYALTLSCGKLPHHYLITQNDVSRFSIADGTAFESIMMLVDNYHNKSDGLVCRMKMPCCRPGYSSVDYDEYMVHNCSVAAHLHSSAGNVAGAVGGIHSRTPAPAPGSTRRELPPLPWDESKGKNLPSSTDTRCKPGVSLYDDAEEELAEHPKVELHIDAEDLENVYCCPKLRQEIITQKLQRDQIVLEDELGAGNFGSVLKGICLLGNQEIPVAVKTLKEEDLVPGVQSELLREAEVMKTLDHKHIVRMIGMCEGQPMMLVLELAKLGPMHKYLRRNRNLPLWNILELMWQVSLGMEYLESVNFIHRDLAARNILLCDEHFAKIADFGLSKTLSPDNNYYTAQTKGKWPLKWYAPESITFWKFDSKTDVWSFGITLWEAASFGAKPYNTLKGCGELLQFVEDGGRLAKPIHCSEEVYDVMLQCWQKNRDLRPSFKALVPVMEELYLSHLEQNI